MLKGMTMGGQIVASSGDDLVFDDEVDAGRAIELIGAAVIEKVAYLYGIVATDGAGAGYVANDAADFINILGVIGDGNVTGSELLAAVRDEIAENGVQASTFRMVGAI